jgi:hypothetical protein
MEDKHHISPADSKMEYCHVTVSRHVAYSTAMTVDGGERV